MKKVCFVTSHLLSGSSVLADVLDRNPRVQFFRPAVPYTNLGSVLDLTSQPHKLRNSAAVYADELLFNYQLQTKAVYDVCKFIYVVRPPTPTLNSLVAKKLLKPGPAVRYYGYRLRRMCEMAKRTPGAVLLTWDDLTSGRGLSLVEEYLGLKEPLTHAPELFQEMKGTSESLIPFEMLQDAEQSYERHLAFLQAHPLRRWR